MKFGHLVLLRWIPIFIAYFFLSLWSVSFFVFSKGASFTYIEFTNRYSLINVMFSVPMNGNGHSGLSSQAGFMGKFN